MAACSQDDARTVNFGVFVPVVAGDSVISGSGQVMESGGVLSLPGVSCLVLVAMLLLFFLLALCLSCLQRTFGARTFFLS